MYPERYYEIDVDLKSSPVELWPFAADTSRFNLDSGLPPVTEITDAPDISPGVRRLQFYMYGLLKWVWDEEPFEWIFPYRFEVVRHYREGMMSQMRVVLSMSERPEGGTHLRYEVWVRAANFMGDIGIQLQFGLFGGPEAIRKTFRKYDEIIQHGGSYYDIEGRARFASGGRERLWTAKKAIVQKESDGPIFDRLAHLLEHADDLALQRLRPYQLADFWKLPRRDVLEVFLRATRASMLDMRWELLCPSCRGAGASHTSLNDVHKNAHCDSCDIDYTVNFDRQVEVIFRPNPTLRIIPAQLQFCVAGPQTGPHIVVNQMVLAGETVDVSAPLANGRYSLTASGLPGELPVLATTDGASEEIISADESGWPEGELHLGTLPHLHLINQTTTPQKFSLKRAAWRDDAATAADVTTLQLFRDLFSVEALRADEEIQINSVTLMFTDLRDSTRLYRQIGDAPAFGRVRQHFNLLEQAIAAEGGAIVKTIGDAVMAVFRQPAAAIRAIATAHTAIAALEGKPPLEMKAGIHTGPCIAVTLNERLDYFGSTVNIAARLPGLALGGEVILSNEIKADPEVETWLRENHAEPVWFDAQVKGYDQPFSLWRMRL
jgi:class 3 adenylate cyclase